MMHLIGKFDIDNSILREDNPGWPWVIGFLILALVIAIYVTRDGFSK